VVNKITNVSSNPTYITQIIGALPTPATVSSRLYPAEVRDPNDRGQVLCAFIPYHACGGSLWDGWTEIAPGVMQRDTAGAILSTQFDGVEVLPAVAPDVSALPVFSPLIGATVLAFYAGSTDADKAMSGPYVLDDAGEHWGPTSGSPVMPQRVATHARMHRAVGYTLSPQFVAGMTFQFQSGAAYGGQYITLATSGAVLGTTPLSWTISSTSPFTETYDALLTGPQCTALGASSDTRTATANFLAGGDNDFWFGWITHTIGLNRTTLKAGIYSVTALVQVAPMVPGTITQLLAHLRVYHVDDSVDSPFLVLTSPPLDDTRPFGSEAVTFQALLAADVAIAETDELQLTFYGHTDSSVEPIFITLTQQAPGRPTFLDVPFELAITGAATGRHPDLSGRELAEQHPRFAITDVIGTATIAGSGTLTRLVLAAPYRSGEITPDGAVLVYGIDPTNWSDGQEFVLFVDGLRPDGSPVLEFTFIHLPGNSDGSDVYVGVDLETGDGQNATYTRPVVLRLKRRARLNRWQLVEATM